MFLSFPKTYHIKLTHPLSIHIIISLSSFFFSLFLSSSTPFNSPYRNCSPSLSSYFFNFFFSSHNHSLPIIQFLDPFSPLSLFFNGLTFAILHFHYPIGLYLFMFSLTLPFPLQVMPICLELSVFFSQLLFPTSVQPNRSLI
jgi:hypothetical protein